MTGDQGGRYKPQLERLRRTGKRSHLLYYLPVTDADTGERLGVLADLSPDGLLLVGHHRYPIGREMRLQVTGEPGSALAGNVSLTAQTEVRWSAPDVNPAYVATGFRFLNPNEETQHEIRQVLGHIGLTHTMLFEGGD